MIAYDKNEIGVVTEYYHHNELHCVLIVRSREARNHYFFYVPSTSLIEFGDIIQMNFAKNEFYVYRGNGRLTYKINPQAFPGTLLWELINEYHNL